MKKTVTGGVTVYTFDTDIREFFPCNCKHKSAFKCFRERFKRDDLDELCSCSCHGVQTELNDDVRLSDYKIG